MRLAVYDLAGRVRTRLHDGVLAPGIHEFTWTPRTSGAPPGVYFLRASSDAWRASRTFVVMP